MNKKISKTIGVLLLLTAVAVTQVPVSDAEASGAAPAEPADGSKSFLDEMEKGFREMMGDGKGAPQDGKPADRTDDEKGDGERK